MVRPVGRTVYGIPRLDIIRIRQPYLPKDEFIIPKGGWGENRELKKNCIKTNVFKQLNMPYN